jgi:hypothetical protein
MDETMSKFISHMGHELAFCVKKTKFSWSVTSSYNLPTYLSPNLAYIYYQSTTYLPLCLKA